MKANVHLWLYLACFFLEGKIFQTNIEKPKTHNFISITFFFENRNVYEVMYEYIVQPDSTQVTV